MAKRSSSKTAEPGKVTTPLPTFGFQRFAFKNIVFSEVDQAPLAEGEPTPPRRVRTGLTAKVGLSDDGRTAQVQLTIDVTPDPRVQPYEIHVEIAGIFTTKDGTPEQLGLFCRQTGPTILFPFVRQMVHSLTTDGVYGPVLLKPVNLLSQLAPDKWVEQQAESADKAHEEKS